MRAQWRCTECFPIAEYPTVYPRKGQRICSEKNSPTRLPTFCSPHNLPRVTWACGAEMDGFTEIATVRDKETDVVAVPPPQCLVVRSSLVDTESPAHVSQRADT